MASTQTDREVMIAMLDRAQVPWRTDDMTDRKLVPESVPLGSTSLSVGNGIGNDLEYRGQPHDGGYPGFWSEIVFDPEGKLIAVWAWE